MDDAVLGARPRVRLPTINVVLFLATVLTTLAMGFDLVRGSAGWEKLAGTPALQGIVDVVRTGFPFAGALIGILLTHEMGHWVLARRHRVDATLPFFIPIPLGFGTLGAVIRIRSALPSRRATLEIGAAGPIAGFCVALPLLVWGFAHSQVVQVGATTAVAPVSPFGLLQAWLSGTLGSGDFSAVSVSYGDSLLTWGVGRLLFGALPPGAEVLVHPVALAAWIGLFITALNMLPVGQLDGGHVVYAALGRERALRVSRLVSWALLACGLFVSWMWLVWWALTRFVTGLRHPPALREEPLGTGQRLVAAFAIALLILTFVPVPATPVS